ncbi:MAG: hypothetical protein R3C10_27845 [Pirellulales bacterium]
MGMLRERLRYIWVSHFAKPATLRRLHRTIRRRQVKRILEFGIGDCSRAVALTRTAAMPGGAGEVTYAAVDLFEARPALHIAADVDSGDGTEATPPLSLKDAYRRLKQTGAQVRLLPGDPYSALSRGANDLGQVDLIVLGAEQSPESLGDAWFYVPRLLHEQTEIWTVRRDEAGELIHAPLPLSEVDALVRAAELRRRAASLGAHVRGSSRRRAA